MNNSKSHFLKYTNLLFGNFFLTFLLGAPLCLAVLLLAAEKGYGQTLKPIGDMSNMPQIWVSGGAHLEDKAQDPKWKGIRQDGNEMLSEGAPWETVSSHTQVFYFAPYNIERATDKALQEAFSDLKRRHMAMALASSILIKSDHCPSNTEAYGKPGALEWLLKKIQRNGGDLQYFVMDEPYYYGHEFPGGCHDSAEEIAREIAENLKMMRAIFPRVKVGDVEVASAASSSADGLIHWADTYRSVVGEPLAFFQADVQWSDQAMRNLVPLAAQLKQRNIPFGIIYNGGGDAMTDEAWTQSAVDHFLQIESGLGLHPDQAIFQSWGPLPSRTLPENQPGTLTNVAFQYLHPSSVLTLARKGNAITGRLTDAHGKPAANAGVLLYAVDAGARMGLTIRRLAAVVPKNAVNAVIGIRANTEGSCACSGDAGAAVGGISYREQGTSRPEDISPVTLPVAGAPATTRALKITKDKTFAPNLKQFPVTPGKPFTLTVPIMATSNAERAGYVMIVFLDSAGKGIVRHNLWFTPSHQDIDSVITDADGRFKLQLTDAVTTAQPEIRAYYAGGRYLRPAISSLSLKSGNDDEMMPALVPFKPEPGKEQPLVFYYPRHDFIQFFNNDAAWAEGEKQWPKAAQHIQVMSFTTQFMESVPDAILLNIVKDLKKKHIGLGIACLATNSFHESPCGAGVEGYSDPGSANKIVSKLLKAGGSLDYIEMDEPLWFGHYYGGKNACKSAIQNLAQRAAVIIKTYTAAFPNVIIGDIEPFPAVSSQPNWEADYANWVRAFHNATGSQLAFLHFDFNWGDPRLNKGPSHNIADPAAIADLAKKAASVAQNNGLQAGMIYNGNGGANTDANWVQQACTHINLVEASGIHPGHAIFISWDKSPSHSVPETDPGALISLINYYFQHSQ